MADVKWIKTVTDIFDDDKFLLIESMTETKQEADSIFIIWFKLLCLAGKQNNGGVFVMGNKKPYTVGMLAAIFKRDEAIVQAAFRFFEDFGMIERIDGVITIPNWEKHQSLDQLEQAKENTRKRVAKHREKQKQIAKNNVVTLRNVTSNVTVTPDVTLRNGDRVDKNRIEEIRIDESECIGETESSHTNTPTLDDVIQYCQSKNYPFAEKFYTYYQSVNWLDKNGKAFDWKAKADYWKLCDDEKKPKNTRFGNFDPNEVMQRAMDRTYNQKEEPRTAGNDENVRKKAEELQKRLG